MNQADRHRNKAKAIAISRAQQKLKADAILFTMTGLLLSLLILGAGRLIGP